MVYIPQSLEIEDSTESNFEERDFYHLYLLFGVVKWDWFTAIKFLSFYLTQH